MAPKRDGGGAQPGSPQRSTAGVQPRLTDAIFKSQARKGGVLRNSKGNACLPSSKVPTSVDVKSAPASNAKRPRLPEGQGRKKSEDDEALVDDDEIELDDTEEGENISTVQVVQGIDDDFEARKQIRSSVITKPIEIHQAHLSDTDKKLRAFDLCSTYGPCVGISRLERWERANKLGLEPPKEIHDILLSKASKEKFDVKESLFYGRV